MKNKISSCTLVRNSISNESVSTNRFRRLLYFPVLVSLVFCVLTAALPAQQPGTWSYAVSAVDEALKSVSGVKSHTAEKGKKSFEVAGDFNDKEVFTALQKSGLTGKVGE